MYYIIKLKKSKQTITLCIKKHFVDIHQGLLVQQLKSIFPADSIHKTPPTIWYFIWCYPEPLENTRKQTHIKYTPDSSYYLELDVWFPKYNICFEFQVSHSHFFKIKSQILQDEYHYKTTWYHQNSTSEVQLKDSIQRIGCLVFFFFLIMIRYKTITGAKTRNLYDCNSVLVGWISREVFVLLD